MIAEEVGDLSPKGFPFGRLMGGFLFFVVLTCPATARDPLSISDRYFITNTFSRCHLYPLLHKHSRYRIVLILMFSIFRIFRARSNPKHVLALVFGDQLKLSAIIHVVVAGVMIYGCRSATVTIRG